MPTARALSGSRGAAAAGCKGKPELLVVTFGKGFGVSGAAALCSSTVADYLLQFARHLIYSTISAACSGAGITCVTGGHSP
ncbi:aminotransferase class I/II-fold pyridoxal phosphate-dependent enzyme [Escherichia coli]